MQEKKKEIWFPAMKYGYGWGLPVTWQGWVVMLAYILLMTAGGLWLTGKPFLFVFFPLYVIVLSAVLIYICWKKGEKPDLRWGRKK